MFIEFLKIMGLSVIAFVVTFLFFAWFDPSHKVTLKDSEQSILLLYVAWLASKQKERDA
jgi:hypothetical protein